MIAEIGKTYAQIAHGKCHWIFTRAELPEWNNEQAPAVDVTGNVPAIGDLWDGTGFAPPPVDAPVVISVSPWQIRKALNAAGLRDAIEAGVAAADQTTKDAWNFAQEFRRDNPLVSSVATALGKTEAEIDAIFALAVTL